MKKSIFLVTILSFLLIGNILSQVNLPSTGRDLEGMFSRIRENLSSEQKLKINDSIKSLVDRYAASDSIFRHKFNNLRFLGQITSPDSLIKIITWNLILETGDNRYYCYFIKKGKSNSSNSVYKLSGIYSEKAIRSDTLYSVSDWYGALYYDIRPFKTSGPEQYYLLLGIDYGNSFVTRKIIDVLTFGPDQNLVFGKKCFADGKILRQRVVFEYSTKVVMSLRFLNDKSVVFDHLSPSSPEYKDNHQFWGPDFTFDSYSLENGLWRFNSNVDVRIERSR
jgi:hypothetical protein